MSGLGRGPALALALGLALAPGLTAQVPPDAAWRTFETEHFRVTFSPGLEALARHAAEAAEAARVRLSADLGPPPAGTIDILLTDYADRSNGLASPFPSNRIVLYAKPPADMLDLDFFNDWIELVVSHELTHIFHLDDTGWLGNGLRAVFGRIPAPWPVFPAVGTPSWSIEGLATYFESRYTGAGRVLGSYHDMVLRTAILEGGFETIDGVTGSGPTWPGPSGAYIYGSMFMAHLAREHGPEVHRSLAAATADAWIPPFLAFDRIATKATGTSFTDAYRAWRTELETRYARLADSLRAGGLTVAERLTDAGYRALHPRAAPDGRVAYVADDARSTAATRVLDPATGEDRAIARRNTADPVSWLPDGGLLTSQLDIVGSYRIVSDLYRVDGRGEHRLTRGARLSEADAAPDGRRAVAVQATNGTTRIVLYDIGSGRIRPLTEARPDVHWAFPRWAPDGARIAAGRWREGGWYDVVVLDTLGTAVRELTHDRALDTAPAWSPDGRYILFSSDRSGIPNLYAYDLEAGAAPPLRQVTNLLTGAFFPDVSPDARWIYFSGYHADGFHIERIPFDPGAWRAPAPVPAVLAAVPPGTAPRPDTRTVAAPGTADGTDAARAYSPFPSLLPRYWLPVIRDGGATGTFFGARTAGADLVGRHSYGAELRYAPGDGLVEGGLSYRYAGLGNPVLALELFRDWDGLRVPQPEAPGARLLDAETTVAASATLLYQRWRSSGTLTAGIEHVIERAELRDLPGPERSSADNRLLGVFGGASFANYQVHPFSISREDGVALSIAGRRRWDLDVFRSPDVVFDAGSTEASAYAAAYKGFPVFGFAHHVLAARASGRWRGGPGADAFGIGGVSGGSIDVYVARIGGSRRFLPVRGFAADTRAGTRGWTASLEYRLPIALVERGVRLWPVFLDRLSGTLFLDAGDAWCTGAQLAAALPGCTAADPSPSPLLAAGAELSLDLNLLFDTPLRLRGGFALPLRGPADEPAFYLELGPSF